jgi:hypothetical protein
VTPTPAYELVVTPPDRRAIAGKLPEAVAAAVIDFLTTALVAQPHRVGKELHNDLAGVWSARRSTCRINDDLREVVPARRTPPRLLPPPVDGRVRHAGRNAPVESRTRKSGKVRWAVSVFETEPGDVEQGDARVNDWAIALYIYVTLASLSFIPVARRLLRPVKLHPGGPSFDESGQFSPEAITRLTQNYERIRGTLGFWKSRAERYRALHIYTVIWVTISTVTVPFLAQAVSSEPSSKWFITIVSAHAALLLALSRAFRVESGYKAFRSVESDFYDVYRRMLDRPYLFGESETVRLDRYFDQVDAIRRSARLAETDSFPSISESGYNDQVEPLKNSSTPGVSHP